MEQILDLTIFITALCIISGVNAQSCSSRTCPTPTLLTDCQRNSQIVAAFDDCDCSHWYCPDLPESARRGSCPEGWKQYINSAGVTLCLDVVNDQLPWSAASRRCSSLYNSKLLNVRQLEQMTEREPALRSTIMTWIAQQTNDTAHWCGLHLLDDKLYWDDTVLYPDRDLTSTSPSIIKFLPSAWRALDNGRECVSLNTRPHSDRSGALVTPEYCSAGYPYICSKVLPANKENVFEPQGTELCEPGWFGSIDSGMCYKYNASLLNFQEAHSSCSFQQAHLIDPRTVFSQRFAVGLLKQLEIEEMPLRIHTAMQRRNSNVEVSFLVSNNVSVAQSDLPKFDILDTPSRGKGCGVIINPYFAEGRTTLGLVQFGSCADQRPFICAKQIQPRRVANEAEYDIILYRDNYLLNCTVDGALLHGKIVWKKDHHYFVNQVYSSVFELNSTRYKHMVGDTSNRTIPHGEMAGRYQCEYWQDYPTLRITSAELPVVFYDALGVRMETMLPNVTWNEEFESFNRRVSQNYELPPSVVLLKNRILSRLLSELETLTDEVSYDVLPLSIRRVGQNVAVSYRVTIAGNLVYRIQAPRVRATTSDKSTIERVFEALDVSPLNNYQLEEDERSSEGVAGHFICLSKVLTHPQTRTKLTLPLLTGIGYHNNMIGTAMGYCGEEEQVMAEAECEYDRTTSKSTWVNIEYADCPTDCYTRNVTHMSTGEKFALPTGMAGDTLNMSGRCNGGNSALITALCTENDWSINQISCQATCEAGVLTHPLLSQAFPLTPEPLGKSYRVTSECRGRNETFISAICNGNAADGGTWAETDILDCLPACTSQPITDEVTNQNWRLPLTDVNEEVILSGKCNDVEVPLLRASCILRNDSRPEWVITPQLCEAGCPELNYTHPDTQLVITFKEDSLGSYSDKLMLCNSRPLAIGASCEGNLTEGGQWQVIDSPRCSPSCPAMSNQHNDTLLHYPLGRTLFGQTYSSMGMCGGRSQVVTEARCGGDIVTGVAWEIEDKPCVPQCDEKFVIHSDTNQMFSFPRSNYREMVQIEGRCNGKRQVMFTGVCEGNITEKPRWKLQKHNCKGNCPSTSLTSLESGRFISLQAAEFNETMTQDGFCNGERYVEVEAMCTGTNVDGGTWQVHVNRCGCSTKNFTHPQLLTKFTAESAMAGESRVVMGFCDDEEQVMLNVTCEATLHEGSRWSTASYGECETSLENQLTNLLDSFKDDPDKLSSMTEGISANLENVTSEIVELMVEIVEFIADPNTPKVVEVAGESFVGIVNNMMNVRQEAMIGSANQTGTSSARLVESVDSFLDSANLTSEKAKISQAFITAEVWSASKSTGDAVVGIKSNETEITLSGDIAKGERVAFVNYASTALFPSKSVLVNDAVMSAKVNNRTIHDVDGAVSYTFKPGNDTKELKYICAYWDFKVGGWSDLGCKNANVSKDGITCSCNHLTNFAILVDQSGQTEYIADEHHVALSVITMVGLSLSIFALTLTLISFTFIKKLRDNQFQKVLANLAFSILATDIVFIAGIEQTDNENACIAIAAILHYFILASFCWMFVEAFLQYRRFVKVLNVHVERLMLKTLAAWIAPAIPVIITLAIDTQLYNGGNRFCWMSRDALYYSFLLPIGCILIANTVLFTLLIRALTCGRDSNHLRTNVSEAKMRRTYVIASLAVFSLLGLTWIFGYMVVAEARLVFSYLFTICNSIQGLVIFFMHNIRHPAVQNWWRSVLRMKPLKGTASSRAGQSYSLTSTKQSSMSVIDSRTLSISQKEKNQLKGEENPKKTQLDSHTEEMDYNGKNDQLTPVMENNYKLKLGKSMYPSTDSDTSTVTAHTVVNDVTS